MELLLNIAWLLLALPAYWLWRTATRGPKARRSSSVLVVLGCTLAILFPVVSASDDIQAMRPEMEEAAARDTFRHSSHARFLASLHDSLGSRSALPAHASWRPEFRAWGVIPPSLGCSSTFNHVETRSGRAPPFSSLA